MLGIYFPDEEPYVSTAREIGAKMRESKVAINFRSANFFSTDPSQAESFDAVLCIECDHVADAYAEKGIDVFRSIKELEASLGAEDPDLSTLSKQELVDLGATRDIALDMSMTKAQMLEKFK